MGQAESTLRPNTYSSGGEAEGTMRQVAAGLRDQTEAAATEGKMQLAAQVTGLARAVRQGSEQLHDDELRRLAQLSDVLASELEAAGSYLSEQDARTVLEDLRGLLRRRGGLLIGGALVAGVLAVVLGPALRQRRYLGEGEHAF